MDSIFTLIADYNSKLLMIHSVLSSQRGVDRPQLVSRSPVSGVPQTHRVSSYSSTFSMWHDRSGGTGDGGVPPNQWGHPFFLANGSGLLQIDTNKKLWSNLQPFLISLKTETVLPDLGEFWTWGYEGLETGKLVFEIRIFFLYTEPTHGGAHKRWGHSKSFTSTYPQKLL